jgi:short subunit dehydrogenase-like uncharacterized protein
VIPRDGPTVVYGATGFTGRLVAGELQAHGTRQFVIAGRNKSKLDSLKERLASPSVTVATAELDNVASLLVDHDASVVINCAGPFSVCGEPVLQAAIDTGTQYVDTTGEQSFMRRVWHEYDARARDAGVAVVCAVGLNCLPGDMAARLAADEVGEPLEEVRLSYNVRRFRPSIGSMNAVLEVLTTDWLTLRDGELSPVPGVLERRRIEFPWSPGLKLCVTYPSGEVFTVPRHTDVRNVTTLINADAYVGLRPAALLIPWIIPLLRIYLRTRLGAAAAAVIPGLGRMVRLGKDGPTEKGRRWMRFTIRADAYGPKGGSTLVVEGRDTYGLTAITAGRAAGLLCQPGYGRSGVLAPAEAFDSGRFMEYLRFRKKVMSVTRFTHPS